MESVDTVVSCYEVLDNGATQTLKGVTSIEKTISEGQVVFVKTAIVNITDDLQNESINVENTRVETSSVREENIANSGNNSNS